MASDGTSRLAFAYNILLVALLLNIILQDTVHLPTRTNQFLIIAMLYICFLILLIRKKIGIKTDFFFGVLVIYCIWIIISTIYVNIGLIDRAFFMISIIISFFLVNPALHYSKKSVIRVLQTISILGLLISIMYLVQNIELVSILLQGQYINYNNISPVLGNKNTDATFIFFGIVSLFIIYKISNRKILLFLVMLMTFSILLAFSRSNYVAIAIFFLFFSMFDSSIKKNLMKLVLTVPCIIILLNNELFLNNILRVERGLSGRDNLWNEAMILLKENWLFGIGIGQWQYYTGLELSPHNSYLKVLVELGIGGLIIYLGIILYIIILGVRIYVRSVNRDVKVISSGLTSFLIAMSIRNYFETTVLGDYYIIPVYFAVMISLIPIIFYNKLDIRLGS